MEDDTTNTFNSQNRNTLWSYDADGRLISTNEQSPNNLPWTPVTFDYTAGQQASSSQTTSRPRFNNPNITDTTTINSVYDGNGMLVSNGAYQLRSSVTGNVIAEYNASGAKNTAYVYAGPSVIAQDRLTNPGPTAMYWQHVNPVTGDGLNTNSSGWVIDRTTADPDGVNVGDSDPFPAAVGTEGAGSPSQSAIDSMVAALIPGWGGPQCYVNYAQTGCGWVGSLLASDAAAVEYTVHTRYGFERLQYPILSLGLGLYATATAPTSYQRVPGEPGHNEYSGQTLNLFSISFSELFQTMTGSTFLYKSGDCATKIAGIIENLETDNTISGEAPGWIGQILAVASGARNVGTVAFAIANAYHETENFTRLRETDASIRLYAHKYRGGPDYAGAGFAHLTHDNQYKAIGGILYPNDPDKLYNNPGLAQNPAVAASILFAFLDWKGFDPHSVSGASPDFASQRRLFNPDASRSVPRGNGQPALTIGQRIQNVASSIVGALYDCRYTR